MAHAQHSPFDPGQRSLFLAPVSSANTSEKRPLLAGKGSMQYLLDPHFDGFDKESNIDSW